MLLKRLRCSQNSFEREWQYQNPMQANEHQLSALSLLRHDPDIRPLLQPLDLHTDARHPAISLCAAACLEDCRPPRGTQPRDPGQARRGAAGRVAGARAEERFAQAAPQHEARGRILVGGGPAVLEPNPREGMVARMVGVEGLVAVEEIVFDGLSGVGGQLRATWDSRMHGLSKLSVPGHYIHMYRGGR